MRPLRQNPLARQIALRIALVLLVTVLATVALAVWFFAAANERFLKAHADEAARHFASGLSLREIEWEGAAYNFKARLEYARILETPEHRQARLVTFVTAQGGIPEHPLVQVLDRENKLVASFEYGSRQFPSPVFSGGDTGWAFDATANALYRVFRQQVWLGDGQNGTLLLYRPIDHSLMASLAFPETRMFALWHGRPIASSQGEESLPLPGAEFAAGEASNRRLLSWSHGATADNPRVLIVAEPNVPVTLVELMSWLSLGAVVLVIATWLILGAWSTRLVRRILALGRAQREFAGNRELTPLAVTALDAADSGRDDELAELSASLRGMMSGVAEYEQRQQFAAARLRQSEERYRFMVEGAQVVVWEFSLRSQRFTYVSSQAVHLLGDELSEWLLPAFADSRVHPDDAPRLAAAREAAATSRQGCCLDYRLRHKEGFYVWVHHLSGAPSGESAEEGGTVRGILLDISARKLLEQRLTIAGMVFEKADEAIMVTNAQNQIIAVNPAFESITGYAADEIAGKDPKLLSAGLQAAEHYQSMWHALRRDGSWSGEVWNRRKSGEPFAQRLSVSVVRDEAGRIERYLAMFSDVTKQKRQAEEIEYQAGHDALSGLPNRRLLGDRIEQAIARAQRNGRRVGIVMLDLDGFKHINDTLGHRIGDLLLVETARRLVHCVRESDTVARVGGDEFMVVLPEIQGGNDLQTLAAKILDHIREPYGIEGKELFVSCSIGLTLFPDDGGSPDELLAHADTAMYRAKSDGKNTYRFFTAEMHEHAVARLRIEEELRRALGAGEFILYYQPVIDLASGLPAKAEALLRWQHPQRGLVHPIEFIPVAEDTGLIIPLGAWVVAEAARQATLWRNVAPAGFCIGVNLSPQQFQRSDCVDLLRDALNDYGAEPTQISVEITESLFIDDDGDARRQLNELKAMGIRVAIDDFGTGYSSLSYLKRFPVDTLKIDQVFVGGLPTNSENAALVVAIVAMSRALGLEVIAEGVETEAQRSFLADCGCRYGQGYLFGHALPAADFARLYLQGALQPAS